MVEVLRAFAVQQGGEFETLLLLLLLLLLVLLFDFATDLQVAQLVPLVVDVTAHFAAVGATSVIRMLGTSAADEGRVRKRPVNVIHYDRRMAPTTGWRL